MKAFVLALLFLLPTLAFGQILPSDRVEIDGVNISDEVFGSTTTTGYCPPRTEIGSTINVWNWRTPLYTIYTYNAIGNPVIANVDNPFSGASANDFFNTRHLNLDLDYDPEEGWELLFRHFGSPATEDAPALYEQTPSFGLYNRYSGRVRIFIYAQDDNEAVFQAARLKLYSNNLEPNGSAIFSALEIPTKSLDNFDPTGEVFQLNRYSANDTWIILESVFNYDPCVCDNRSMMITEYDLIGTQSVVLHIDGTAFTTPMYDQGTPKTAAEKGFSLAAKGFSLAGKGLKSFNTITDYFADANSTDAGLPALNQPDIDNSPLPADVFADGPTQGGAKSKSSLIKDILPGVFSALPDVFKLLDFVVGQFNGTAAPKLIGYETEFKLEAEGDITSTQPYEGGRIRIPGSDDSFEGYNESYRPIYDNPVGVFNMVKTPIIHYDSQYGIPSDGLTSVGPGLFRFEGDFEYVLNTDAGLGDAPLDIKAALIFTPSGNHYDNDLVTELTNYPEIGVIYEPEGDFFRTPFLRPNCLSNHLADLRFMSIFDRINTFGQDRIIPLLGNSFWRPTLQVVVSLDREDGGGAVLYTATYEIELQDMDAETILNGSVLTPLGDVAANNWCAGAVPPPTIAADFCREIYDATISGGRKGKAMLENKGKGEVKNTEEVPEYLSAIKAYPNPFNSSFTLELNGIPEGELNVVVYDLLGKEVYQSEVKVRRSSKLALNIIAGNLAPGTYYCKVSSGTSSQSVKLLKQ